MARISTCGLVLKIFLLVLFIPFCSLAQVTIKERLEIKPHSSSINRLSSSGDSTFTARIDWDISYDTPGEVQLSTDWDYVCDRGMCALVESGDRFRTYSVNYTPSGLYVLYVWHYGWPDSVHVNLTVGESVYQFTIGPYNGWGTPPGGSVHLGDWGGGAPYTTPFSRWFRLNVGAESISAWETNGFGIEGRVDACTGISWYSASDSVMLSIISGSKLGGFVLPGNSSPLGSVRMLASDIPSVSFVVSDSGALGGMVTVAAESKGIVDTRTFRIRSTLGNRLKLFADSPIAFGGGGTLRVALVDATGSEVEMPSDLTFTFRITQGSTWAWLHDDYSGQTDSVIAGVPSIVGLVTIDTARYDDKVVHVNVSSSDSRFASDTASVVIWPGMLKLRVTPASLSYGQSAQMEAEGIYSNGVLRPVYPGILYTYEIVETPDAGYLTAEGDTTALDVITDIGPVATFVAKEETPQNDSVRVIVKVTAKQQVFDARIESNNAKTPKAPRVFGLAKKGDAKAQGFVEDIGVARVTIKKPQREALCVRVSIEPASLAPGDTATVRFKTESGQDFDLNRDFDVWIVEGGSNVGTLRSPTQQATALTKTKGPIVYIAPSSADSSLKFHIAAFAYDDLGGEEGSRAPNSIAPILKKGSLALATQVAKQVTERKIVADLNRRLALNVCGVSGEVEIARRAVRLDLEIAPNPVVSPESATLKVILRDRNNDEIAGTESNALVSYSLGVEVPDFGGIEGSSDPLKAQVSYASANGGNVKASLGRINYDGRFPVLVSVSTQSLGHLRADKELSIVGPHTMGKMFRQSDSPWGPMTYDHTGLPIGGKNGKGCALSCVAMVLKAFGCDASPQTVNDWMNSKDEKHGGYYPDGNVNWTAVGKYEGSSGIKIGAGDGGGVTVDSVTKIATQLGNPPDFAKMDQILAAGMPVIAQVVNPDSNHPHFIVVTGRTNTGDYRILDPGTSKPRFILKSSGLTIYRYLPVELNTR